MKSKEGKSLSEMTNGGSNSGKENTAVTNISVFFFSTFGGRWQHWQLSEVVEVTENHSSEMTPADFLDLESLVLSSPSGAVEKYFDNLVTMIEDAAEGL